MAPSRSAPRVQRNFSRGTAVTDEKAVPWVLRQVWQWQWTMRSRGGVGLVGDGAAQAASGQHDVLLSPSS